MKNLNINKDWNLYPKDYKNVVDNIPFFENKKSLKLDLPTDIHSALFENNFIVDPFHKENELDLQWIALESWVIEKDVDFSSELEYKAAFLKLTNVDTIAKLYINDKLVSIFDNQFKAYNLNIRKFLKKGSNNFKFIFFSAEKEAIKRANKLKYFIPYSVYPVSSKHRNLVRKTQCHSGWDWGPCFMTNGIYDDLNILFTNDGYIESIKTDSKLDGDNADLKTIISYYSLKTQKLNLKINIANKNTVKTVSLKKGLNKINIKEQYLNIKKWYPNEVGKPFLYEMITNIGESIDKRKIGFREIKINNKTGGLEFIVNGIKIFAKGANWIPQDALFGNYSKNRYEYLIESCKTSHMNMIRLWGGGHYEKDEFYNLCDEKGILIWHDAMFSCSMYPSNKEFLESVEDELYYQINRLQYHPSIALWCGNNEDLGAITWYPESRDNRDLYVIDYDRLNEGVVHKVIKEQDPNRYWWPSSPCAGQDNYNDNWHDDTKGDMHFWSVWHEGKDFEEYYSIKPRFVSEFGYQSFPSLATIESFTDIDDRNITSKVMEHHQKNPRGNSIILENFCRYYRFPTSFESQVYLSQVQQAEAMKMAIEYFRSLRNTCMGTLYWQLNDNWPSISWSSIDYKLKYKALHYESIRFYNNTLLTLRHNKNKILLSYVNDNPKDIYGKLEIFIYDFEGNILNKEERNITIKKETAELISSFNKNDYDVENNFIVAKFNDIYAYSLLSKPKSCNLKDSNIKVDIKKIDDKFEITLKSIAPAFNVFVDTKLKGNFSDNNFLLIDSKTITYSNTKISVKELENSIKVFDLYSSSL